MSLRTVNAIAHLIVQLLRSSSFGIPSTMRARPHPRPDSSPPWPATHLARSSLSSSWCKVTSQTHSAPPPVAATATPIWEPMSRVLVWFLGLAVWFKLMVMGLKPTFSLSSPEADLGTLIWVQMGVKVRHQRPGLPEAFVRRGSRKLYTRDTLQQNVGHKINWASLSSSIPLLLLLLLLFKAIQWHRLSPSGTCLANGQCSICGPCWVRWSHSPTTVGHG